MGSEGIQELRSSATALHHRLEESASLLTMFWRAALLSSPGPALVGKVPEPQDKEPNRRRKEHRGGRDMRTMGESMKKELLELRTKLSKQESLLQSTSERLKTANQQKESMEQFIFSQCGCPGTGNGTGNWGAFQAPHLCCEWTVTREARGWGRLM
ncbi:myomegalin-like isoform X1 [Moschus berezovskii]|uniref:myomegalin-like isoform X1 n=1 Tax=Moschus berezovskii TaxID=68408 RepID=UPI002443898C|nr:myomegalin-like isoform X1 [Moschus berezovskii]